MLRKGLGNNPFITCYAKQALPATPSWVVSSFPNGIRRRNSFPTRKTVGFKAFSRWNLRFIRLSKQVEILIST